MSDAETQELKKEAKREYARKWYAANSEKAKASSRKWHSSNTEKANDTSRKWYAANSEKAKESARQWQADNPFYNLSRVAAYRQRKRKTRNSEQPYPADIELVWNACGGKCALCEQVIVLHSKEGRGSKEQAQLDAIIPGNGYTLTNMTFLCGPCNRSKSDHVLSTAKRLYKFLLEHQQATTLRSI